MSIIITAIGYMTIKNFESVNIGNLGTPYSVDFLAAAVAACISFLLPDYSPLFTIAGTLRCI